MPFPEEQQYTIDDIYNLPDGTRAELIDGQIFNMGPPSTMHQRLVMKTSYSIQDYVNKNNGSCEVFMAPFAVFLNSDNRTYVEPDISVICDKSKLDDKGCHGAPDWIIEIVSPISKRMDYYIKLTYYRLAGVQEYWIIDPMKETVIVYDMANDSGPTLYSLTDKVKVNIYEDLYIDFQDIMQSVSFRRIGHSKKEDLCDQAPNAFLFPISYNPQCSSIFSINIPYPLVLS